jgi:uncharacterized protein
MEKIDELLDRIQFLVEQAERTFFPAAREPDWDYLAYRWGKREGLRGIANAHVVMLEDLLCLERQKDEVVRNTRQFVTGRSANNVLLWGSRGTGKSSLIKGVLNEFADQGLRVIQVDKEALIDLPDLIDLLWKRPERFILYCDDLSFEADEPHYKALKAVLDGAVAAPPENVLIYATSNRRHLLPEYQKENQEAHRVDEEIHQGESVEEKISLSERFGLWVAFHPFNQEQYLRIVDHWLAKLGADSEHPHMTRTAALQWALKRGSRSGRVAWQFAREWAGRV